MMKVGKVLGGMKRGPFGEVKPFLSEPKLITSPSVSPGNEHPAALPATERALSLAEAGKSTAAGPGDCLR